MDIILGDAETVAHDRRSSERIWRNENTVESQNIMVEGLSARPARSGVAGPRPQRERLRRVVTARQVREPWAEGGARGCRGSIPEPIHNWTGDYSDLTMNRSCGEPTTITNGFADVITELDDARLWHADFCGDDREEVIEYVRGEWVRIVANGPCDLDAKSPASPCPRRSASTTTLVTPPSTRR